MKGAIFRTRTMSPSVMNKVFETPLSTCWFDEEGIFCLLAKPGVPLTKEALTETFSSIKTKEEDHKFCVLGDITDISFPTTEARDFAGEVTPKFVKALAFVTNSDQSRMIADVFFTLKKPTYQVKLFRNEQNAREWLKKFL